MERQDQTMQESKTGNTLKKLDDVGTRIESILPCAPGLQGRTGHIKRFGGLTLGQPLGLQGAILLEECGASDAIPTLVTTHIVTVFVIDYSAHSYLLTQ